MRRTSALSTLQNGSFRKGTLRLFVFFFALSLEHINLKLLTTKEIFSYRPDHFSIFVGRSTSFLGAMFKYLLNSSSYHFSSNVIWFFFSG